MTIETKYKMGQTIFTLIGGLKKVVSGEVNSIYVERVKGPDGIEVQKEKYTISNGTGPLPESEWFPSKEDLLKSL